MGAMWGEGGRSPREEVPKTMVLRTIESFLVADDPWEDMESTLSATGRDVAALLCGTDCSAFPK